MRNSELYEQAEISQRLRCLVHLERMLNRRQGGKEQIEKEAGPAKRRT